MKKPIALSLVLLSACVDSAEFDARPYNLEFVVGGNYQAVYAGMLRSMRHCLKPGTMFFPTPAATTLDGQLYSELGYGEIVSGMSGVVATTQNMVRISKVPGGAKVQIKTGNATATAQSQDRKWLAYWAKGGSECPTLSQMQPPA